MSQGNTNILLAPNASKRALELNPCVTSAPPTRVGVSSEPDHSVVELTDQDRFMILASDGVWEFITSKEAVQIVSQCEGAEEACRQVNGHIHF